MRGSEPNDSDNAGQKQEKLSSIQQILLDLLTGRIVSGGCKAARKLVFDGYEQELEALVRAMLDRLGTPEVEIPPDWEAIHIETTVRVATASQPIRHKYKATAWKAERR